MIKVVTILIMLIGCIKNNFKYNNRYKNDIDYYFKNIDKLNENVINYIIENAENRDNKALFLYVCLLKKYPLNEELVSKIYLLNDIKRFLNYLHNNNYFMELGFLYKDGIKDKLKPNVSKAIEYYEKAIEIGSSDAANILGVLYEDGIKGELESDINRAIEYYEKAIEMGNSDAASNLGVLYNEGVKGKLEPNIGKAIEYYNKAIEVGDSDAANNLGYLYNYGVEGKLEPNIDKAIECYEKAIEIGNATSAINLGYLYNYGVKGKLEPNISKAIEYYNKAKKMGYDISKIDLDKLYDNLILEKLNTNEVVKCVFDLYDKYKYKHSIVNKIFKLDYSEANEESKYKITIVKYISSLYNKYKNYILEKLFISNDEVEKENNDVMATYLNNIRECYAIILGQKISNDTNSTVSLFRHNSINSDLFLSYDYISNYLECLLELLKYFDKHNFMITCIELKDKPNFNNKEEYVKLINIKDRDYTCLGENEGYFKLLEIINRKEKLLDHINRIINNISTNTDLFYALKEIVNIENQLYDILECTVSIRNRAFLSKYIDLFK